MLEIEITIKNESKEIIATHRQYSSKMTRPMRNIIVRNYFNEHYGKYPTMDIYAKIHFKMKEQHNIRICERTIMRILNQI